jgi:predicted phosphodiesterase
MMKFNMRLLAIALTMIAVRGYAAEETPPSQAAAPVAIVHGPYLHAPRADSMTIAWFTDKPSFSWVEYGEGKDLAAKDLSKKAVNAHFGLVDAGDTRHVVQLKGLEPGKTYSYRVVAKEITKYDPYRVDFGPEVAGKILTFTTCDPKKDKFSFCVFSDIHEHDRQLDEMLQKVDWQGVDLIAFDGDMINDFSRESQIFGGFLDVSAARFAGQTPMVWVRGNHETRGSQARRLIDFAPVPEGRFYYSFNHGGVHFIILDSGEDKADSSSEYSGLVAFDPYREEQTRWLQEDLRSESSVKAAYRIALFHMPPVGSEKRSGVEHLTQLWRPLLNQAGVDLVISGHIHTAKHIAASEGGNRFDLVTCSPTAFLRVDVDPAQLKVAWQEFSDKEKQPETFVRKVNPHPVSFENSDAQGK